MTAFLLSENMAPFSIALGLLVGLMLLELVTMLLGGSLLGLGGEADVDADLDLEAAFDADLDVDADLDGVETDAPDSGTSYLGPLSWLGLGKAPFMIWFASFLLGFGLGGLFVQSTMDAVISAMLPAGLAAAIMAPLGLAFARGFAGVFTRLLPKSESTAVSENHLGRTRGVVSQGTAKRGRPAEVRVQDRHGNTHYIRAEPLDDDAEIRQGTQVIVMRRQHNQGYRLVALTE